MIEQNTCPIDEDPDWAPDGQTIVFTRHVGEAGTYSDHHNNFHAEGFLINADGTGLQPLTDNDEEERAPEWSPDGTRHMLRSRRSQAVVVIALLAAPFLMLGDRALAIQNSEHKVWIGRVGFGVGQTARITVCAIDNPG